MTTPKDYYFYIDCEQADAFGHWVFESAYLLPLFKLLQQKYSTIKLLSFKEKNFMNCMYKACNILETEVCHKIDNISNTVLFPECSHLAVHSNRKLFLKYIHSFYSLITSNIPPIKKTISVLYLPRGSRENFKPNDRTIPCQEQLIEALPHIIPESFVYFTDKLTDLKDQIAIIRSAKILIVDYGSNLMFNGFFAEDCKVLVIGNHHRHIENPRTFDLIEESEKRGVLYYYLPASISAMEVAKAISVLLTQNIAPFQHKLQCWRHCELCSSSSV